MVPGLLLSLWAAYRVRSTYGKWDKVDSGISMNAFDFARYLLNSQGLNQVTVESDAGQPDRSLRPAHSNAAHLDRRRTNKRPAGQRSTRWVAAWAARWVAAWVAPGPRLRIRRVDRAR